MYTKLKTKPFKGHIEHAPTFKDIDEVVNECYKTCYFSTFPYIHNNDISSRTALKKYNSGNCIAMSMYIQKQLRKKNIISYLIPATVPNKYRVKGYLDISHVALAIPVNDTKVNDTKVNDTKVNDTKVYLIDPAFYFLKPILITLDSPNRSYYGMSKNIYKTEIEDDPKKYASIDYLNLRAFKTTTPTTLNDYQYIPKNTYYVKCHTVHNADDPWFYYMRKVVNPDQAIGKFFLEIKNDPFICKTHLDKHGIVRSTGFLMDLGNKVASSLSDDNRELYYKDTMTQEDKQRINDRFSDRVDMSRIF